MSNEQNTKIVQGVKEQLKQNISGFDNFRFEDWNFLNDNFILEKYADCGYKSVEKAVIKQMKADRLKQDRRSKAHIWAQQLYIPCPSCSHDLTESLYREEIETRPCYDRIEFTENGMDYDYCDNGDGDSEFERYYCNECDNSIDCEYVDEWEENIKAFLSDYIKTGKGVFKLPDDLDQYCMGNNGDPSTYEQEHPLPTLDTVSKITIKSNNGTFVAPKMLRQELVDSYVQGFKVAMRKLRLFAEKEGIDNIQRDAKTSKLSQEEVDAIVSKLKEEGYGTIKLFDLKK